MRVAPSYKTWFEAQSLCEDMHPRMSLAEFNEPGEQAAARTAILDILGKSF